MTLPEPQLVYLIIPVHNRRAVTLRCLQTLQHQGDLKYRVIVVDDGSTDGTTAAIAQNYPAVTVLAGSGQLWWTGAIGAGMAYACQQGAVVLIWLNDDCLPAPGALTKLVHFVTTQRAIAGATCYSGQTLITSGFRGRKRVGAQPGEAIAVDGMSGFCVALPAAMIRAIGLPNARRYPQYGGDNEYLLRAKRAGFQSFLLGDALVTLPEFVETTGSLEEAVQRLPSAAFRTVFCHPKSPFYLPSQFFYRLDKYGVMGLPIFFAKLVSWLGQWIGIRTRRHDG